MHIYNAHTHAHTYTHKHSHTHKPILYSECIININDDACNVNFIMSDYHIITVRYLIPYNSI